MPEKHLHIISFDIPYPPNYGGVIDVFFKIRALHEAGVKIHLHCIEYPGRDRSNELNKYCESVNYYRRKTGLVSALSIKPYIVSSRRSPELISNLLQNTYPILFEGLHSCYYLTDKRLKTRFKIYRESNIEHRYYYNLFRAEQKLWNKVYYLAECIKLRVFQRKLKHSGLMLAVSGADTRYLQGKFKGNTVEYIPSFHTNTSVDIETGKGDFVLYHGNIEVPENALVAAYLITKVFNGLDFPLIIAGMNPPLKIRKLAQKYKNVKLIINPDDKTMFSLIRNAQINILITFQATGLKLKLLNTLYNGRHCIVNPKMLSGTHLDHLCIVAHKTEEIRESIQYYFGREFNSDDKIKRSEVLETLYNNRKNAEKLISLIP